MDINARIYEIIQKYNIDYCYPEYRKRLQAEEEIRYMVSKWNPSDRVLCVASSELDAVIFERFIPRGIRYSLLIGIEGGFNGVEFYDERGRKKEVDWSEYQSIWLISKSGEAILEKHLRGLKLKYVNLYDCLAEKGMFFLHEYYDFLQHNSGYITVNTKKVSEWKNPEIIEIYNCINKLNAMANTDNLYQLYFHKILFLTLYMKDFILAEKYWRSYINEYPDDINLAEAWREISEHLNFIGCELEKRNNNDIVMYWIDKVPYEDVSKETMPYCNGILENESVCYDRMYTVTPYTHPSMHAMWRGEKTIDDDSWKSHDINTENSPALRIIEENGYTFVANGLDYKTHFDNYLTDVFHDQWTPASEMLWETIRQILLRDSPVFVMTQMQDTHEPSFTPYMNDNEITNIKKGYFRSRKYVDQQIEYYDSFLKSHDYSRIFMSDHGRDDFKTRFHVIMAVASKQNNHHIDSLCTNMDFYKIVHNTILRIDDNGDDLKRDYVEIQDYDWMNGNTICEVFKGKECIDWLLRGYRGVITNDCMYIHFHTGEEWFWRFGEEMTEPVWFHKIETNRAESGLISTLRTLAQIDKKVDFSDAKLKYSYYVHKVYEKCIKRNWKKIEVINELFSELEGNVALRMGGVHSLYLYEALSVENRSKIKYVVDCDENCICASLPIKVIKPASELTVNTIVMSSYDKRDILDKEKDKYSEYNIVDIYEYLKKNGIECKYAFYRIEPTAEEFDVGFPYCDFV